MGGDDAAEAAAAAARWAVMEAACCCSSIICCCCCWAVLCAPSVASTDFNSATSDVMFLFAELLTFGAENQYPMLAVSRGRKILHNTRVSDISQTHFPHTHGVFFSTSVPIMAA